MNSSLTATRHALSVMALVSVFGCSSIPTAEHQRAVEIERENLVAKAAVPFSSVEFVNAPYVGSPTSQSVDKNAWLKSIPVSFDEPTKPLVGTEVLRIFKSKGVNVVTNLPLEGYTYAGFGLAKTDAETALTAILGSMGLDYESDSKRHIVEVMPLRPHTWRLNIGPRTVEFTSNGGNAAKTGVTAQQQGAATGLSGVTASSNESSNTKTELKDDFWDQLDSELTKRLTVLVPVKKGTAVSGGSGPAGIPAPPSAGGGQQGVNGQSFYDEVKMGRYSINKSTGAVTVQAPKALLKSISTYLNQVNRELNTRLVFEGRIILITGNDANSEGIDFRYFKDFASKYGLVLSNSVLSGGVTITPATATAPLRATTSSTVSSNVLGVVSSDNMLQAFDAFLESHGQVRTLQKPYLTTTSGVPVVVSQFDRIYVNNITETASSGLNTASTAVQNNLIPYQFGTSLRISPRYNLKNGTIRAEYALSQVTQSGTQTVEQIVSNGQGAASIFTQIPLDRKIDLSGETLVKSGDMIVIGGQVVKSDTANNSGLTGTLSNPLRFLTSRSDNSYVESTYYVALQVKAIHLPAELEETDL